MNKSDWLTVELLRELVSYDPHTGVFTDLRGGKPLRVAESTKTMYLKREDGKYYQISPGRCAWMLMSGQFPPEFVRTKVPGDYRWKNLEVRGQFQSLKDAIPFEAIEEADPMQELRDRVAKLEQEINEMKQRLNL